MIQLIKTENGKSYVMNNNAHYIFTIQQLSSQQKNLKKTFQGTPSTHSSIPREKVVLGYPPNRWGCPLVLSRRTPLRQRTGGTPSNRTMGIPAKGLPCLHCILKYRQIKCLKSLVMHILYLQCRLIKVCLVVLLQDLSIKLTY